MSVINPWRELFVLNRGWIVCNCASVLLNVSVLIDTIVHQCYWMQKGCVCQLPAHQQQLNQLPAAHRQKQHTDTSSTQKHTDKSSTQDLHTNWNEFLNKLPSYSFFAVFMSYIAKFDTREHGHNSKAAHATGACWWIHYSFQSVISPAFGAIAKLIKYLCI